MGSKSIYARILHIISDARKRDTEAAYAHILCAISDNQEREKLRKDCESLFPLARELGRGIGEALGEGGVTLVFNDDSAQLLQEAVGLLLRYDSRERHNLYADIREFLKRLKARGIGESQSTEA